MATSTTLTGFTRTAGGRLQFSFADGNGYDFANGAELREFISPFEDPALVRRVMLAMAFVRSPTLTDLSAVLNKTMTIDLSQNPAVQVQ